MFGLSPKRIASSTDHRTQKSSDSGSAGVSDGMPTGFNSTTTLASGSETSAPVHPTSTIQSREAASQSVPSGLQSPPPSSSFRRRITFALPSLPTTSKLNLLGFDPYERARHPVEIDDDPIVRRRQFHEACDEAAIRLAKGDIKDITTRMAAELKRVKEPLRTEMILAALLAEKSIEHRKARIAAAKAKNRKETTSTTNTASDDSAIERPPSIEHEGVHDHLQHDQHKPHGDSLQRNTTTQSGLSKQTSQQTIHTDRSHSTHGHTSERPRRQRPE